MKRKIKTVKATDTIEEIKRFALANKGLLVMVANPLKDEIVVSFGNKSSYVKFPVTDDVKNNILVKMMSKSDFAEGMNELLTALIKTTGIKVEDGQQMYQAIGGSVQAMVYGEDNK